MAVKLFRSTDAQLKNLEAGPDHRRKGKVSRSARLEARLTPDAKEKIKALADEMGMTFADFLEGIADGEIEVKRKSA